MERDKKTRTPLLCPESGGEGQEDQNTVALSNCVWNFSVDSKVSQGQCRHGTYPLAVKQSLGSVSNQHLKCGLFSMVTASEVDKLIKAAHPQTSRLTSGFNYRRQIARNSASATTYVTGLTGCHSLMKMGFVTPIVKKPGLGIAELKTFRRSLI